MELISNLFDPPTLRNVKAIPITSRYGPIDLNIRRDEVEGLLGRPENYALPRFFGYKEANLWIYGKGMEFYLYYDEIAKIHNDWLPELGEIGSRAFKLTDLFFLDNEGALLNNKQVEEKLRANAIRFEYYKRSMDDSLMILCESGVMIDLQMNEIVNGGYGIHSVAKTSLVDVYKLWSPVANP